MIKGVSPVWWEKGTRVDKAAFYTRLCRLSLLDYYRLSKQTTCQHFTFFSTHQLQISCILFSVSPHYINKLAAGYVHLLHTATTTKTYNSPLFQVQYLPATI